MGVMVVMVMVGDGHGCGCGGQFSPFHKRTLCGNVVGSIAFSDHKTIRNNFCKIIFSQKCGEVFKLDPPIFTALIPPKLLI